ncbi:carboxypeptidase S1-like protein B [Polychaeton citri CBS 116435]|uniref:Carboxypeptidase n=1 Tax=Polychaeton citri CBS 116435 TaxID=1314669 RepID=A0A9P4QHR4_9PEZI|nr:carboxypeptidase S1-like protein B [Polychaeton citri CBS 116435]
MISQRVWCLLACLASPTFAQFPPTPEGVTVLQSKFGDGVSISYKDSSSICETTPDVKSYSGYVHLPPGTLDDLGDEQDYPINTFFWFFEARNDPTNAPLSIWMNGGPGSSSLLGLLVENGPCFVNPDSNSTTLNQWSWNNDVNMLYIDQPVQVGLSYDTLQNITSDLVTGSVEVLDETDEVPEQNATFLVGTYPSQNRSSTSLGSAHAARAFWQFAQTWFQEFPAYHPNDSRIAIATESYGGRYGPAFATYLEEQNQKIENGTFADDDGENFILHLDTLMIINGCIDRQVQWPSYPHIAYNNTYGIQTVDETVYEDMIDSLYREGGCRYQINDCRELAGISDPDDLGNNATVNDVCEAAETFCSNYVRGPYLRYSGRNYYDFATLTPAPTPPGFYQGYLNQPHVQAALGVPLNWTQSSSSVSSAFRSIGDYPRPGWLSDLAYLLDNGIKVALVYGDRDFACNWIGGEAISLAINYSSTEQFHEAGYSPVTINDSYVGGQVRQHGNLSFTRVYEAGHEVPAYQPETAFKIFERVLFNMDVATGNVSTAGNYSSKGSASTWQRNQPIEQPLQFCYVLDPSSTCTEEQINAVEDGSTTICRYIVKDRNSTQLFPGVVGSLDSEGCGSNESTGGEGGGTAGGSGNGTSTADTASFVSIPWTLVALGSTVSLLQTL